MVNKSNAMMLKINIEKHVTYSSCKTELLNQKWETNKINEEKVR